jgi:hypothetical protein
LQRVPGSFVTQMAARQSMQFIVDQRHQPIQRVLVAVSPVIEKAGHFLWRRWRHRQETVRPQGRLIASKSTAFALLPSTENG